MHTAPEAEGDSYSWEKLDQYAAYLHEQDVRVHTRHVYIYIYVCIYVDMYMNVYISLSIYIYIYTYIDTICKAI